MRPRNLALALLFAVHAPLLALALAPPPAHAGGTSVFAGAGPRFTSGETTAVGALRASFAVESLISFAIELDAYLTGPSPSGPVDFAGGQAGFSLDLPLPGPITPELGLSLGLIQLVRERHGDDSSLLTVNGELALRAALGPIKLRVAWTKPLWMRDEALAARGLSSQLVFSLGVGL